MRPSFSLYETHKIKMNGARIRIRYLGEGKVMEMTQRSKGLGVGLSILCFW